MSVINNSGKGDTLVIIDDFEGPPEGVQPSPRTNRAFRIGDQVEYLGFFQHPVLKNNPVCWMVRFRTPDGKNYAATQTYFVTEENWESLQKHLRRRRKPRKAASVKTTRLNGKRNGKLLRAK